MISRPRVPPAPLMKFPFLALALATSLAAGCSSSGQYTTDHWSEHSVGPSVSRYFLGYDAAKDGDYRDFQWRRKQDVNLLLRRYFLNHNPDNSHQREVASRYAPRPNHSLLPNPVRYIHVEGLVLGFAVGFPLPVDSILGTLEPGGFQEFNNGIKETLSPLGTVIVTPIRVFTGDQVDDYAAPTTVEGYH